MRGVSPRQELTPGIRDSAAVVPHSVWCVGGRRTTVDLEQVTRARSVTRLHALVDRLRSGYTAATSVIHLAISTIYTTDLMTGFFQYSFLNKIVINVFITAQYLRNFDLIVLTLCICRIAKPYYRFRTFIIAKMSWFIF